MATRQQNRQNLISVTSIDMLDDKYLEQEGAAETRFRPVDDNSFQSSNQFRQIIEDYEEEESVYLDNFKNNYSQFKNNEEFIADEESGTKSLRHYNIKSAETLRSKKIQQYDVKSTENLSNIKSAETLGSKTIQQYNIKSAETLESNNGPLQLMLNKCESNTSDVKSYENRNFFNKNTKSYEKLNNQGPISSGINSYENISVKNLLKNNKSKENINDQNMNIQSNDNFTLRQKFLSFDKENEFNYRTTNQNPYNPKSILKNPSTHQKYNSLGPSRNSSQLDFKDQTDDQLPNFTADVTSNNNSYDQVTSLESQFGKNLVEQRKDLRIPDSMPYSVIPHSVPYSMPDTLMNRSRNQELINSMSNCSLGSLVLRSHEEAQKDLVISRLKAALKNQNEEYNSKIAKLNYELKLKKQDLKLIEQDRELIQENAEIREENQKLKRMVDYYKKQNVEQRIWEKRVEDLHSEVERLNKELWESKNLRHLDQKQHNSTIQKMKDNFDMTINHIKKINYNREVEMTKMSQAMKDQMENTEEILNIKTHLDKKIDDCYKIQEAESYLKNQNSYLLSEIDRLTAIADSRLEKLTSVNERCKNMKSEYLRIKKLNDVMELNKKRLEGIVYGPAPKSQAKMHQTQGLIQLKKLKK